MEGGSHLQRVSAKSCCLQLNSMKEPVKLIKSYPTTINVFLRSAVIVSYWGLFLFWLVLDYWSNHMALSEMNKKVEIIFFFLIDYFLFFIMIAARGRTAYSLFCWLHNPSSCSSCIGCLTRWTKHASCLFFFQNHSSFIFISWFSLRFIFL